MIAMNRVAVPLLLMIVVCGCVMNSGVRASRQVLEAQKHATLGFDLFQGRAYNLARAEFGIAYNLYASVDDMDGMGTTLLNQVRTDRLTGHTSSARIGILHATELLPYGHNLLIEFIFEEAMLELASGNIALARKKSEVFLTMAPAERKAAGHNLMALVAIKEGNKPEARRQASVVIAAGDEREQAELANSHRILGELDLEDADYSRAAPHFGSALYIDRKLGKSPKIVIELRGLARAAEMEGDTVKATAYLKRAMETARASGDTNTARSIEVLLNK